MCWEVSNEQKLIDLCFEMVLTATSDKNFCERSDEVKVKWVRENLAVLGFVTAPCGMSWGVLKKEIEGEDNPKSISISINGQYGVVYKEELSYQEVINMARARPNSDVLYMITYYRADGEKTEGSLEPGGTVKVKDGTKFSCYYLGRK